VSLLIGEDLPPSRVGAPDLHFSGSSWSLDIKWLIVILSLNCQRFLVEIPNLRFSSIWCLDDHVSVVNQVHVSVAWHSWNNVEVSKDIESKFFIEFSLPGFTLPFISVDYIPLLVNFTILVSNNDVSILSINVSLNFNDLCFLVNNVTILIFEELPPSWVNAWCEMKVGWSAVGLDFHGIVLPLLRSDSLINIIEEVLLCCDILSPSFEPDVVSTVALSNSLHWKSRSNVEWSVDMESEFSWKSLSLNLLCLVFIDNIPSLVNLTMIAVDNYFGSFFVLSSWDIKNLVVGPVDELVVLVLEELPPVWIGAPDLHVLGFSWALDVEWLVVQSCLDSQRSLVEIPCLGLSSIWCLDDHGSVTDQVEVSVWCQFRDNEEISLNEETEVFVKFSLNWFSWILVNIDDVPLLVNLSMLVPHNDVSVFSVKTTMDIDDLTLLIDNESILVSPQLPPSWFDCGCEM
jgi:hypothetical protein